jgi:hypothetical protein
LTRAVVMATARLAEVGSTSMYNMLVDAG